MVTYKFVLILALILCVLLVLIILAQNPKGGGLSSSIGGGSGSQMFGVQQTNKFLVNTTWAFAIVIAVIVLFSGFLIEKPEKEIIPPVLEEPINLNQSQKEETTPSDTENVLEESLNGAIKSDSAQ